MMRKDANRLLRWRSWRKAKSSSAATAVLALAASGIAWPARSAGANTLTWDGGNHTLDTTYGGSGTWDTSTTTNWTDIPNNAEVQWTDTTGVDTADFKGTVGSVALSGTLVANGLIFEVSGYTLAGGTLDLAGTTPLVSVSTGTVTISSTLAGSGFTKSGAGMLALMASDNSSYSGSITLNAGGLTVGNANALGTGPLVINGGTFTGGAFTLGGNNVQTWNGSFILNVGSSSTNTFNLGTGAVTLGSDLVLTANSAAGGGFVIGGNIGGNHSLTLNQQTTAATAVILAGTNSWSGGTTLNGATLVLSSNASLPSGTLTIANSGGIAVKSGVSTITLGSGTPETWASGANFTVNHYQAGNVGTGTLNTGNGNNITLTGNVIANVNKGALIVPGAIVDSLSGSHDALTISLGRYTSATATLSGANTFDGGLTLKNGESATGILNIGNLGVDATASALGTGTFTITNKTSSLTFNNSSGSAGTLMTNNPQNWDADFTFGSSGSSLNLGTGAISLGTTSTNATRTVTVAGQTLTAGGMISNGTTTTSLTKAGNGTLNLAGTNSYTGSTTVSAGTLQINGSIATANVAVTGGTLSGSGTIVFNLGSTPDEIVLSSGTLNVSGLTLQFAGSATQSSYTLVDYSTGGTLTKATNAATDNTFFAALNVPTNYVFTNDTADHLVTLTFVPEPGTFSLLAIGGLSVLARRRRRNEGL